MTDDEVVRGWAAAALVTGRSVAGLRKLVAAGRLHSERDPEGVHSFLRSHLESLPHLQGAAGPRGVIDPQTAADGSPPPADLSTSTLRSTPTSEVEVINVAHATSGADCTRTCNCAAVNEKIAKLETEIAKLTEGLSLVCGIAASQVEVRSLWDSVDALNAQVAAVERRLSARR